MPAGRPPNKFVQDHFIKGQGVDNDSKRFYYHCYYCNDERELQHRDSRLALHLTSYEDCPNAPESARAAGFQEILRKGKVSQGEIGQPLLPLPPTDTSGSPNLDSEASNASGTSATVTVDAVMIPSKKRRSQASTLAGWVDVGLTERQISEANLALFRACVSGNLAFLFAENPYFQQFINILRPTYTSPSRYVLSSTIMDAESARAHIEECDRLKNGKCFTLLTDGWEDIMKRSLYGTVAAKVGELPIVLSLEDLT